MKQDERKQKTKKAIENAMIELLKDKNFDDISTSQLAATAGISRSSFYTHYKDKYEMIDQYQKIVFSQLEYVFDKHQMDRENTLLEIFEFLDREALFAALLTQNGTIEIQNYIRNKLQQLISHDISDNNHLTSTELLYDSVYFSHAMFGIYQMWVTRGKKESPKQVTKILLNLLPR